MANGLNEMALIGRDGTSQAARLLDALDPGYVAIDERSAEDLLAFVREYAKELRYFGPTNLPAGDWSAFLGATEKDLRLADLAAFLREPARFTPDSHPELFRPHLTLFLAFLKLFRAAQSELNTIASRHLEFYYRQVLGMTRQPAVPDHVNLLLDLAAGVGGVEVPAGSRVSASPDSLGRDLIYSTDRRIVVNRAQIAKLSSLYIDRRLVGFPEARVTHLNDRSGAAMAMLKLALGDPNPGDPLPPYTNGKAVDDALLASIADLLHFAETNLFLKFFDLRSMMVLKHRRDAADGEWTQINNALQKAGTKRDSNFKLPSLTSRDFDGNLQLAIGGKPDFAGLPEVKSVYDLYDHRTRSDAIAFIQGTLFMDPADFVAMMQIKIRIDSEWAEINRILQQAGATKTPGLQLAATPGFDPTNFAANLKTALNPNFSLLPGVADIEAYYAAVLQVEGYFFVSAEEVLLVLTVMRKTNPDPSGSEWEQVEQILAKSHREKVYSGRRAALQRIREQFGFIAMARFALGEDPTQPDASAPLDRLKPFVVRDSDFATLQVASSGQPAGQDWPAIYAVVEVAQRNREAMPEPVAQRVDWLNMYAADDATKQVVLGFEGSTDLPRWKTFGMPAASATQDNPPPSLLGWAIGSPLLAMSEGARTITLTVGCRPEQFDQARLSAFLGTNPIRLEVSTKKGWKEATVPAPVIGMYAALTGAAQPDLKGIQWKLQFDETVDSFAPPPAGELADDRSSPVLRLTLRQIWNPDTQQFTMPYPPLADLLLVTAFLKVEVAGLKALSIANDETTLNPKKPFLPFGSSPTAGGRFFIGHPEIVAKKLDSLTFNLEWLGAPKNLVTYYANYGVTELNTAGAFTARISLTDQHANRALVDKAPLFSNVAADSGKISLSFASAALPKGYVYDRIPDGSFGTELLTWNRYFVWELNSPDFQHQSYPAVASGKAVELSVDMKQGTLKTEGAAAYKVNPPYTPKLKTLKVDYSASIEVRAESSGPESFDRIFHIHPFGYSYMAADPMPAGYTFLPRYESQGELYIGLRNVDAPQNLALLFQAAEGSADPDLIPPAIAWGVLDGDRWVDLDKKQVLADTTRGLINTGILEFDLPAVEPSMRLPGGVYWIRAAATANTTAVCDTIAFHTQAVTAILVDNNNAPDHFATPLPAGSIKKFAPPIAGISGVRQPYTSSGGRPAERDALFYTRVSERLRHKQRALTTWDYERLVLARFPEIYKVKCVPASISRDPDDAGSVQLVVIPDIRNKRPFDPFEPKAPADMLTNIEEYLSDKIPLWATVRVGNPRYVAVKLRLAVRFSATGDENYYKQVLNDDLNRFLSPWAYEEGADIVIGGRIYANSIVDFVDRRPYVDFLANLELFSSDDGQNFSRVPSPSMGDPEGYFIEADRPDGILVAAREHQIDLIPDTGYSVQLLTGIEYMKLELDFVVA